jgi:hypothetical protein
MTQVCGNFISFNEMEKHSRFADYKNYIDNCTSDKINFESFIQCCRKDDLEFAIIFYTFIECELSKVLLEGLFEACHYNSFHVFKWIDEKMSFTVKMFFDKLFNICCKKDSLEILQFLVEKYNINTADSRHIINAFFNNSLRVANWLDETNKYSEEVYAKCLTDACLTVNKNVCRWLIEKKGNGIIIDPTRIFSFSCNSTDIEHVKFIFDQVKDKQNFNIIDGLKCAIMRDNLAVLEWMMSLHHPLIEKNKEEIFYHLYEEEIRKFSSIRRKADILKMKI